MIPRRRLLSLVVGIPLRLKKYSERSKQAKRHVVTVLLMLITSTLLLTLFMTSLSSPKEYVILDDTFDTPVLVEKVNIRKWSVVESRYIVDNLDKLEDMLFRDERMLQKAAGNPQRFRQDSQNDDSMRHHFVPRHSFTKQFMNGMENNFDMPVEESLNALVAKGNIQDEDPDQVLIPPGVRNNMVMNNKIQDFPQQDYMGYYDDYDDNEIPRAPKKVERTFQYIQSNIPGRDRRDDEVQRKTDNQAEFDFELVTDDNHKARQTTQRPAFVRQTFIHSKTIHYFPIERIRKQDSKIPKEFFNIKTIINPHTYRYIINPKDTCKRINGSNIFVIVPIISSLDNFKLRETIRKTWGQFSAVYGYQVRFVFMLGTSKLTYLQDLVKKESDIFGDIVQESFIDTYVNSTLKAIFTLRWVQTYCANAKFMLRLNDDVMVHQYKFIQYLRDRGLPDTKLYWGQVFHDSRVDKGLAKHEYRSNIPWREGSYYPPYCNGPYILMTMDVVKNMYKMSSRTPLMFPEDVYYGILAEKLGIRTYDASMHLVDQFEVQNPVQKFRIDRDNTRPEMMGHLGSDDQTPMRMEYLWKMVERRTNDKKDCVKRKFTKHFIG
ncbi:uncharacterized protein LOC135491022 isoform X2 [Lineus longissimus]